MSKWARAGIFAAALVAFAILLILSAGCASRPPGQWHDAPRPPKTPTAAPSMRVVRMGDPCSPAGAKAKTASGNPLSCILYPGEKEPRWRIP